MHASPMTTLYITMTEELSPQWREHDNAYSQKFVLTPRLRDEYICCLQLISTPGRDMGVRKRMGVLVEVAESTASVMVGADDTEVLLQ